MDGNLVTLDSLIHTDSPSSGDLYFAYAANMHPEQMRQRCGVKQPLRIARLDDYRLAFHGYCAAWDSAHATVAPSPGAAVWGVLYPLKDVDWERLDNAQDARMDGSGAYFHYPVEVLDSEGRTHRARMYKFDVAGPATAPSAEFLDYLIAAAELRQLPADYLARLRSIAGKPAKYAVPRALIAAPSGAGCEGCGE